MKIHDKSRLLIAGLCALLLLLSGCKKETEAPSAPTQPPPPEVGITVVRPQSVRLTSELPGRTAPRLIAEVRPQVGGIIQKRLFTEGTDVKAGQVLYQIDPALYRAEVARAEAALTRAMANVTSIRQRFERYRELVKVNAVSQQDYDDTSAALRQAEAEIEVAKAALQTARINLDYTTVKAPISGRIGRSAVTDGALVTANQPQALATIQQLDTIYVDVVQTTAELLNLKRNIDSGLLRGGDRAKIDLLLEDGTAYPLAGELKFSEVTVDQSTGSVTLRAIFPNPDHLLLPGMFVRAIVTEGVNDEAILVPQRGVNRNPAGDAVVMTINGEEKVEPRVIQVARTVGEQWLVSGGLHAGDRIILEGLQKARPGTPVKTYVFGKPAEEAAPAPAAGAKE
ncbi:MAG: efflux RND transporter periplasmic adaptor subunit [Trichloromonas sp.]|jgi:membrane fusion protein (multidrug efflux system)|nr:efflux RND transporter periplasmic adaptor subunit [Trichloromonas sp.]